MPRIAMKRPTVEAPDAQSKSRPPSPTRKRSRSTKSAERRIERYPKNPLPAQHQDKPGLEAEMKPRPQYAAPHYKPAGKLAGRTALITGGDSGIGRAVAVLYAKEGADVAITHLPEEERDAQQTKAAVESAGRRCLLLEGDLTNREFCQRIVDRTVREFGKLDILVNNAAYQQHQKSLGEIASRRGRSGRHSILRTKTRRTYKSSARRNR